MPIGPVERAPRATASPPARVNTLIERSWPSTGKSRNPVRQGSALHWTGPDYRALPGRLAGVSPASRQGRAVAVRAGLGVERLPVARVAFRRRCQPSDSGVRGGGAPGLLGGERRAAAAWAARPCCSRSTVPAEDRPASAGPRPRSGQPARPPRRPTPGRTRRRLADVGPLLSPQRGCGGGGSRGRHRFPARARGGQRSATTNREHTAAAVGARRGRPTGNVSGAAGGRRQGAIRTRPPGASGLRSPGNWSWCSPRPGEQLLTPKPSLLGSYFAPRVWPGHTRRTSSRSQEAAGGRSLTAAPSPPEPRRLQPGHRFRSRRAVRRGRAARPGWWRA